MGALPHLIELYQNADRLMLRRNAQVLLTNVSMLAENAPFLQEANISEEFKVPVPMRLTDAELSAAEAEFGPSSAPEMEPLQAEQNQQNPAESTATTG